MRWLGFTWDGEVRFASAYFQQLFDWAVYLVERGDAYVCDLNAEQAREYRGTLTQRAGTARTVSARCRKISICWRE